MGNGQKKMAGFSSQTCLKNPNQAELLKGGGSRGALECLGMQALSPGLVPVAGQKMPKWVSLGFRPLAPEMPWPSTQVRLAMCPPPPPPPPGQIWAGTPSPRVGLASP